MVTEPLSWISFLPLAQVPLQKKIHFGILMPSWHYFCILCILLGKLSDYQVFEFASMRYQCIVQSYNTRMISENHKLITLIKQGSFIWKENPISGRRCFHITFSWTCSSGELTLSDWPFWMILEIVEKVAFRYIKLKGAVVCKGCHTKTKKKET